MAKNPNIAKKSTFLLFLINVHPLYNLIIQKVHVIRGHAKTRDVS